MYNARQNQAISEVVRTHIGQSAWLGLNEINQDYLKWVSGTVSPLFLSNWFLQDLDTNSIFGTLRCDVLELKCVANNFIFTQINYNKSA